MNKPLQTVLPHLLVPLQWNKVPLTQQKMILAKLAELAIRQRRLQASLEEKPHE
jgi:hypothetical protein